MQFEERKLTFKGCGIEGESVPCPARKYISHAEKKTIIYHKGIHTCPVMQKIERDEKYLEHLLK